jgi:site-specific recombinase XerD
MVTLAIQHKTDLARGGDLLASFGAFLRLSVADGDASAHTLRSYHSNAAHFVTWCAGFGIDPARATDTDLMGYRKALVDEGYATATVGVKLAAVRRLYDAAQWHGLRADNPAAGLKAPRERTARAERVKYLPLTGLARLLAAPDPATAKGKRDRAILALMGRHGLRVAEVASLSVGDLDLSGDQPRVTVNGKGRKTRTVYLTPPTVEALQAWLAVRPQIANGTDALFVAVDNGHAGSPIGTMGLRWVVDSYLAGLGLKAQGISCHALRHSAATWARFGGAQLDAIAGMLGHASVTTTQVYAQVVDKMRENPAAYLDRVLEGVN